MSDGILTVTGFARFEKLHAEYNKLQQEVTKLNAELKKTTNESKRSDDQQQKSASTWESSLRRVALQYVGIQQAIRAVIAEQENLERIQGRAAQGDVALADAWRLLSGSMGPTATAAQDALARQMFTQAAVSSKMRLPDFVTAGAQAMSATEGAPDRARISRVIEAVQAAAPMFRSPEKMPELGQFAGAALDLQRGVPGLSLQDATTIMFSTLAQARIVDVGNIKNAIPAAVAAQVTRPNAPQLENTLQTLSMFAALGGRLGEPTGELSRTAIANLAATVQEMGPKTPEFEKLPLLDAVAYIAENDPKLAKEIQGKVKGKGATKPAVREFFDQLFVYEAARSVRPNLLATLEQAEEFNKRIDEGSEGAKRTTAVREYAALEEERIRRSGALPGEVRTLLFGGELDERSITGALPEAAQYRTGGTYFSRGAAKFMYNSLVKGGMDPRTAGIFVAEMVRGKGLKRGAFREDPRETEIYEQLYETLDNLQPDEGGRNSRVLDEIYKQRIASEQQAVTTQNALQGAAAAAQGKNQQE